MRNLKIDKRKLCTVMFALISAVGVMCYMSIFTNDNTVYGTAIFGVLIPVYVLIWAQDLNMPRIDRIVCALFSYGFALSFSLGAQFEFAEPYIQFKKAMLQAVVMGFSIFPVVTVCVKKWLIVK